MSSTENVTQVFTGDSFVQRFYRPFDCVHPKQAALLESPHWQSYMMWNPGMSFLPEETGQNFDVIDAQRSGELEMVTFLPYADFTLSARCLDWRRLGKQRVEALQIINSFTRSNNAYSNHPTAKMWEGSFSYLLAYYNAMVSEWEMRGYNNNMRLFPIPRYIDLEGDRQYMDRHTPYGGPWWLGWEPFHSSHRATLLSKDALYYMQFNWKEKPEYGYLWPTK